MVRISGRGSRHHWGSCGNSRGWSGGGVIPSPDRGLLHLDGFARGSGDDSWLHGAGEGGPSTQGVEVRGGLEGEGRRREGEGGEEEGGRGEGGRGGGGRGEGGRKGEGGKGEGEVGREGRGREGRGKEGRGREEGGKGGGGREGGLKHW